MRSKSKVEKGFVPPAVPQKPVSNQGANQMPGSAGYVPPSVPMPPPPKEKRK